MNWLAVGILLALVVAVFVVAMIAESRPPQ